MREARFVKIHRSRWQEFEQLLNTPQAASPEKLASLFVQLTDDLAYARTHYPDSPTTAYLNALTARTHQQIYRNKKENYSRLRTFWTKEVPLAYGSEQKAVLVALLIFLLSVGIGALSAAKDATFVRLILGDQYVNMTLENIAQDDPMAVYKKMHSTDMFAFISLNNIMVALRTFALGLVASLGTAYALFQNGVMLGAFQQFFHQHGLLTESALIIWIHGTLEIAAIVLAGGAGLVLGNSLLFPGTLPRKTSLLRGARKGLKMVIGLVPVFIIAALLESFVTRLTEMPVWLKLSIILLSAAFILWYFVLYPYKLTHQTHDAQSA